MYLWKNLWEEGAIASAESSERPIACMGKVSSFSFLSKGLFADLDLDRLAECLWSIHNWNGEHHLEMLKEKLPNGERVFTIELTERDRLAFVRRSDHVLILSVEGHIIPRLFKKNVVNKGLSRTLFGNDRSFFMTHFRCQFDGAV